jgi:hypothetical protein
MTPWFFLLTALVAFPFAAFGGTDDEHASIGRYHITAAVEGLYFLDTATGQLWIKVTHGEWERVDSPVDGALPIADVPAKPVSLTLPKAGETMPMVQREKRAIPGSSETLWVHLGDITGGQVFVEVRDINGQHLVERTSLKSKEFVKFKVNETDVYLQIAEMVNNLLDEDICQVHLSFKKPKLEEKPEESNDPKER